MHGDPSAYCKQSSGRLQQSLMAARQSDFETIQRQAPFSRLAQRNMEALLGSWRAAGKDGFARAWDQLFQSGWEADLGRQNPIQIIGDGGDSEEHALEVKGAPDQKTRVAAEWWYLRYTFGWDWTPGMHFTTTGGQDGVSFSVRDIMLADNSRRDVFFRLPD